MTLFFLHAPRTGGTALRLAFEHTFGADKVLSLYTPKGEETSPVAKQIFFGPEGVQVANGFDLLSDHIVANGIELFTSHHSAVKLRCFDPSRSFIMLRHPVDRLVSAYRYVRQRRHTEVSFDEYASHPGRQNTQSKLLGGIALESVGVVGLFDQYDDFVRRLNQVFGLSVLVRRENQNRFLSRRFLPFCSAKMVDKILCANELDLELYERAKRPSSNDAESAKMSTGSPSERAQKHLNGSHGCDMRGDN